MSFYSELNKSPWRGVISEVGIGLEFTAGLMGTKGVSNTVFCATCDYDRTNPVRKDIRKVSLEYVKEEASQNYCDAVTFTECFENHENFGLSISGAHYQDRRSHAWVAVTTARYDAYMHIELPRSYGDRRCQSRELSEAIQWFLSIALLKKNWMSLKVPRGVDVIYAPGISDVERLIMLRSDDLLAYQNGQFIRVIDALRSNRYVYPGSFNPPTKAHTHLPTELKSGVLYEISIAHHSKGNIAVEDLLHRIRMLNAVDKTVIISRASTFVEKHKVIKSYVSDGKHFVAGADVWNELVSEPGVVNDDRLSGTTFMICERGNYVVAPNRAYNNVEQYIFDHREYSDVNSSDARDRRILKFLDESVRKYISNHGLY